MKTIAIMQPVYLPWLGYFEQMAVCDEFMFLDDVQYTKEDWRNRNKIRKKDGSMWLTVPIIRAKLQKSLLETEINYATNWPVRQLNAIRSNYSPAPYFEQIFPIVEEMLQRRPAKLVDLTIPLVLSFAELLGIETPIYYASQINKETDTRMDRIAELCHSRNADVIYTGPAAKAHVDESYLSSRGVGIVYQNYIHPAYKQQFDGFETHMSILDLVMNHGAESREILLSSPLPKDMHR